MMLAKCKGCGGPVLEIEGQFEVFDSYFIESDRELLESVGDWHTTCFFATPHGLAWYEVKRKNFTVVRSSQILANTATWTVLEQPRTKDRFALSKQGELLSLVHPLGRLRKVPGGSIYRHEDREYNLELEQRDIIHAIQESLLSVKTFPILALTEALGISDKLHHPEALEGSMIHYERSLRREWSDDFVSARWEYGVFVPEELVEYVRTTPLPRSS